MGIQQTFGFWGWLRRRPTIFSIVIGTVGVLMIVIGALGVTSTANDVSKLQELRASGGSIELGTMVDTVTKTQKTAPGLPTKIRYCPQYAYTAGDGVAHTIVDYDNCVSNKSQLPESTVKILVDASDPATAFIDDSNASVGRTSFAIFAWSTLTIGAGVVVAASIMAVRARRGRGSQTVDSRKH